MVKTTFYVQIEPEWSQYRRDADGEPSVSAIKARRMTQARPATTVPGTVTVKLSVEIPESAFKPLRPQATIVIPENLVETNDPIQVYADDPSADLTS